MSERRACRLINADRKTVHYPIASTARRRLARPPAGTGGRAAPVRLSPAAHSAARRGSHVLDRKKSQRLYREEGLTVRKRKGRKRAMGMRAPILVEARPNARWSVDFVHDLLSNWAALPHPQRESTTSPRNAWWRSPTPQSPAGGWRARTRYYHRPARQTRSDHLRPWNRVHLQRYARLGSKQSDRLAFHCAWKTDAQNGICEAFNGRMRDEPLNEDDLLRSRSRPIGAGAMDRCIQSRSALTRHFGYLIARRIRRSLDHNGRSAPQPRLQLP